MRRSGPRPIADALAAAVSSAAPATLLGRAQACWGKAVGPALAGEAEPVAEHGGALTVACRSAAWAQELELLGEDLRERLNRALGGDPGGPVRRLRFRVARPRLGPRARVP